MSTVVLSRRDNSTPWGFRMQGGLDFSAPLTIARVTPGTVASNAGLQAGDIILSVNGHDLSNVKHSDAQRVILDAGNSITFKLKSKVGYSAAGGGGTAAPVAGVRTASYDGIDSTAATAAMQNLNIGSVGGNKLSQSARYDDAAGASPAYVGYINPDAQSQAFKVLQSTIDSGKNIGPGVQPWQRLTVNEISLEPKTCTPSPTFLMVKAEEAGASTEDARTGSTSASRSAVGSTQVKAAPSKALPPVHVHATSKPGEQQPSPAAWAAPTERSAAPAPPPPSAASSNAIRGWQPQSGPGSNAPAAGGSGLPVRGSAVVTQANIDLTKIPICDGCRQAIRGPFVVALGKTWCPNHFTCAKCNVQLVNVGFIELGGAVYCEGDYEKYFAPSCARCNKAVVGDAVNALNKTWHPKCFVCFACHQPISEGSFHVEEGNPYCTKDWSASFQIKCKGCDFPVEPGDKWVEAMGSNYHADCFNCAVCNVNLEGKPFFPKNGKPYCKTHTGAR